VLPDSEDERGGGVAGERVHDVNGPARDKQAPIQNPIMVRMPCRTDGISCHGHADAVPGETGTLLR
jgi:hypothetical protein